MSDRHRGLVMASGSKSGAGKSKPKSGGKRKLKHMVIRPVEDGGFVTEKHFEPPSGPDYFNNSPDEKAHEDRDSMMDHVEDTFPSDEDANASGGAQDAEQDGGAGE
jgi:hypothetical protein